MANASSEKKSQQLHCRFVVWLYCSSFLVSYDLAPVAFAGTCLIAIWAVGYRDRAEEKQLFTGGECCQQIAKKEETPLETIRRTNIDNNNNNSNNCCCHLTSTMSTRCVSQPYEEAFFLKLGETERMRRRLLAATAAEGRLLLQQLQRQAIMTTIQYCRRSKSDWLALSPDELAIYCSDQ